MFVRVVTDRLRIRSAPGVTEQSIKLEPLMDSGVIAFVIDGPVSESGYDWYLLEPLPPNDDVGPFFPAGWVAAGTSDEAWLVPEQFACPVVPADEAPWAGLGTAFPKVGMLACYGSREVSFTSRLGTPEAYCGVEPQWWLTPDWFDNCLDGGHFLVPVTLEHDGWWDVTVHPDVSLDMAAPSGSPPEEWPIVNVTGQFDHPAAATCSALPNVAWGADGETVPEPRLIVHECRKQFVVTALALRP